MKKLKLEGKELRKMGFPEGPVISIAMQVMEKNYRHEGKEKALTLLAQVLENPAAFAENEVLCTIAEQLLPKPPVDGMEVSLNKEGISFGIFGSEDIEQGALNQMYLASRLPVAIAGAIMPDAHQGYGLPIGGVLATNNAVIPYGVGVDIGCRMCLSVFDINTDDIVQKQNFFARELNEATLFGSGKQFDQSASHEVLDRKEFNEISLLKPLQGKAAKQLGTSGSGNHFVEFGVIEITEMDSVLGIEPGKYLGLLSHSGSRALGANIANHYTRVAKQKRKLLKEAANLAWLSLDEEEGIEYWMAMNLAGDYASACHHVIHEKIAKQLGRKPIRMVENHHNFAWKEMLDEKEVIIHRKGATPAGKDVLGIIPGSMTAPGFIVKGRGQSLALNSASHGAGRKLSRTAAIASVTHEALQEELQKHQVKLIGGGLDEAPFAYKDINTVMQAQQSLVDIVGRFTPKIVKMDGASVKQWHKK